MRIQCELELVPNPADLPEDYLPSEIDVIQAPTFDSTKAIEETIEEFNSNNGSVLSDLFSERPEVSDYVIKVIATQGVPEPYDAWFIEKDDVIIFNLSLWEDESLCEYGKSVLIHEVAHSLLHKILPRPYDINDLFNNNEVLLRAIEYHTFDEGIAHFCAYRDKLDLFFSAHADKEQMANDAYECAVANIQENNLCDEDKEFILQTAFSGSFWEKFGDIKGLFHTARLYQEGGTDALKRYIDERMSYFNH